VIQLSTCDLEGNNCESSHTHSRTLTRSLADTFKARALVAADGADSELARKLGVVTSPPSAYCSRSFAKVHTGTHYAHNQHNTTHLIGRYAFVPRRRSCGVFL